MKIKLFTALIALATLAATQVGVAATSTNYYGTTKPIVSSSRLPTDIHVNNYGNDNVYIMVPESNVYGVVYGGGYYKIYHHTYYGNTHIVLENKHHQVFFDRYVCRHATINITGSHHNLRVNVNNAGC